VLKQFGQSINQRFYRSSSFFDIRLLLPSTDKAENWRTEIIRAPAPRSPTASAESARDI
jgi:hypothetical protein